MVCYSRFLVPATLLYSEIMNVRIKGTWGYTELMPIVPIVDTWWDAVSSVADFSTDPPVVDAHGQHSVATPG